MKTIGKLFKERLFAAGPAAKKAIAETPAHLKSCFSKAALKNCFSVRGIVYLGLLIAMSIVLRLFTSINIGLTARIELGFLPIAVAGVFFGPIGAALAYTVADLLGTVLAGQPLFLPITLLKLVFGFILGLFFYQKRLTPLRVFFAALVVLVLVDLLGMTLALSQLYSDKGVFAVLIERIYNAAVTFPLRFFVILLTDYSLHLKDLWHRGAKNA